MIIEGIIITVYTLALLLIFIYALAQLNLLLNYLSAKKKDDNSVKFDFKNPSEIPFVTIQLPIYNELYVVEGLLENISKVKYPQNKLEIQVLDDSTDESTQITIKKVKELQQTGLDIKYIHRTDRTGFKAGALKAGLESAKGEYIAIFDADFLPKPDWLLQTIPYFKDSKIGVVQTRWGHINRNYSLLTKIQAFALDTHFTLEQTGRNSKHHFINFNGTAGVWRKACILDAGNWEGDTLTEDLDLSYRAQLKKWHFKYLENVVTPAELPIVISAARSQQFRWNKGGAENFQKMFFKILKSKTISAKTKIHGFLHLLNSTMFLSIFIVALLSVPMLYIKHENETLKIYFYATSFFVISSLIFFICYWLMYKKLHGSTLKNFVQYLVLFFAFFSIAMGLSLHNTIAVLEGHFRKRSDFIRTPKFNLNAHTDTWKNNIYLKPKVSFQFIVEGFLMCYFAFGMYSAFTVVKEGDFGLFPFHLMLFLGFGYVFFKSLKN
ncbi:Glycosyltransferase, catalytic subunit of cellulose synthase and poly-beta-1,6-N-acetylglucosamine synthase [Bizionia echini]|uniref:Glycosyltransferase, catalytic subunit of cellulose synthase and poly-beta-1,6-N-acetylglucosamine synthase n=1 Tax=Bizionia echini TaxID=649333 RepID=A0A1I4YLJ2_9FLAO|nr:cellulose synthase family protein [Bizionia echini]SFN38928.1 Glycosyltransferase, catalytic subunit of cellulose synthase and poly-beta-1,6-N-acetylglucosamine synthase [Bizionia echini]